MSADGKIPAIEQKTHSKACDRCVLRLEIAHSSLVDFPPCRKISAISSWVWSEWPFWGSDSIRSRLFNRASPGGSRSGALIFKTLWIQWKSPHRCHPLPLQLLHPDLPHRLCRPHRHRHPLPLHCPLKYPCPLQSMNYRESIIAVRPPWQWHCACTAGREINMTLPK